MVNAIRLVVLCFMLFYAALSVTAIAHGVDRFYIRGLPTLELKIFFSYLHWGVLVMGGVVIFAISPFGDKLLTLFFGIRKITLREAPIVEKAKAHLEAEYYKKYGKHLTLKLYVRDVPYPMAWALGKQTVAVSTGLLNTSSEEEVIAVIGHEMGHLHYKDSMVSWLCSIAHMVTTGFYWLFVSSYRRNELIHGMSIGSWVSLLILIIMVLFFPYYVLLVLVFSIVLKILRKIKSLTDWPIEYRADQFAVALGLGKGLIGYFERSQGEDIRDKQGFLSYFAYSHPPTAVRIDRMERGIKLM